MNASSYGRRLLGAALVLVMLTAVAVAAQAESSSGYLGVMLQDIGPSMAKALQLDKHKGVLVTEVVDGSPASAAGLQDGDVILEFDGQAIADAEDLTDAVGNTEPGDKVKLLVLRDGKREKVKVEVGARPGNEDVEVEFDHPRSFRWHEHNFPAVDMEKIVGLAAGDHGYLGVKLSDLTDQLGDYFGVEDGAGALITEVNEDSPAAKAHLQAGDVITKVDDEDISSTTDLLEAMAGTDPGDEVSLTVVRKGKQKTYKVTLAEMPAGDRNAFFGHAMKGAPQVRILRQEFDDQEMDQLHEELDKLRGELDKLRQEVDKLK